MTAHIPVKIAPTVIAPLNSIQLRPSSKIDVTSGPSSSSRSNNRDLAIGGSPFQSGAVHFASSDGTVNGAEQALAPEQTMIVWPTTPAGMGASQTKPCPTVRHDTDVKATSGTSARRSTYAYPATVPSEGPAWSHAIRCDGESGFRAVHLTTMNHTIKTITTIAKTVAANLMS